MRILKILGWTALALVVAAVGLILWLRSGSGRRTVTRFIGGRVEERLGGELGAGKVKGNLLSELTLHDLHFRSGTLTISIDKLHAEYDLWRLLGGELRLQQLQVQGLRVRGRLEAAAPAPPSPASEPGLAIVVDHFSVDGDVELEAFGGTVRGKIDASGGVRRDPTLRFADLRVEATGSARLPGVEVPLAQLHIADRRLRLAVDARAEEGSVELRARGTVGRRSLDLELEQVVVAARGQKWRSTSPGRLRVSAKKLAAQLSLHNHKQQLTVDATLDRRRLLLTLEGRSIAVPSLPKLDFSAHAELRPRAGWKDAAMIVDAKVGPIELSHADPRLAGMVEARAELHGTLLHPLGSAQLHGTSLRLYDLEIATLDGSAEWDGQVVTGRASATQTQGGSLQAQARLPKGGALLATVEIQKLAVALRNAGPLRQLDGTANGQFQLEGRSLQGQLKLDAKSVALLQDTRQYGPLTLDLVAHDDQIELRQLSVEANGGRLDSHGTVELQGLRPKRLHLIADARRFPIPTGSSGAWVDAHVELEGQREGERFAGRLTITRGRAQLPAVNVRGGRELQPLGPLEDVVFTGEPAPEPRRAIAAEVIAHIPGPFQIRSPELSADVEGKVDVRLTDAGPRLYGQAKTTWGQVELIGRRYEIERALFDFAGRPDPILDVRVKRAFGDAVVVIELHGTASQPELVLSSEPPIYDSSQLIGIIVAGNPDESRLPDTGARSAQQTMASALSGLLVDRLTSQLLPGLPVDVLRLEAGSRSRLEVGRYLTDRLYVSYVSQFGATLKGPHNTNANEANVELRIRPRLVARLRYGDAGVGSIDVSWAVRF